MPLDNAVISSSPENTIVFRVQNGPVFDRADYITTFASCGLSDLRPSLGLSWKHIAGQFPFATGSRDNARLI